MSFPATLSDRKSTRLNSSHSQISYAVFCLKKKTHLQLPRGYGSARRLRQVRHVSRLQHAGAARRPGARCARGASAGRAELFFFNDTATTEIYTLSLHDALPI